MRERDPLTTSQWLALLARATSGDAAAENLFFERLRCRLMAWAGRLLHTLDVDDLVQDTLIVVHAKYRALRIGAALHDQAGFDRWCRRILYHRIGNDIRRRRLEAERRVPVDCLLNLPSTDRPDRRCEASERRQLLARALRHLNATQRSRLHASQPSSVGPARGAR